MTLPIQLIQDLLLLTIAEAKINSNPSLKDLLNRKNKTTFFKQEEISNAASTKETTLKDDGHLYSPIFISCQADSVLFA